MREGARLARHGKWRSCAFPHGGAPAARPPHPSAHPRLTVQDNREERTFGAGKSYQFMMRTRQPAGSVTNQLYLVMDELADLVRVMNHHLDGIKRVDWCRCRRCRCRRCCCKAAGRCCHHSSQPVQHARCRAAFAPTSLLITPPPSSHAQYGNGSLRLTTRQTFQLHGVLKQNLKTVFSTVRRRCCCWRLLPLAAPCRESCSCCSGAPHQCSSVGRCCRPPQCWGFKLIVQAVGLATNRNTFPGALRRL